MFEGLAFVHGKSILHRDLKPDNIMLRYGEVKIIDFGLSRVLASPCDKFSTDVSEIKKDNSIWDEVNKRF